MSDRPSADYLTGARKWGCEMCPRGQRMKDYIEELEAYIDGIKSEVEGGAGDGEGDNGEAT